MSKQIKEKPNEGVYKTICPHCDARLMSGRSIAMRTGINVGIGTCPNCQKSFVQRLTGDAQSMETCKLDSPLSDKWHKEAYASNQASISPYLEPVP